jgi:hypothetical protein
MSYSIGINAEGRDIGYSVPSVCDHPGCNEKIDRGMSYLCEGCQQYFCTSHLAHVSADDDCLQLCRACASDAKPYPAKPDTLAWLMWKLEDASWAQWREDNPDAVCQMKERVHKAAYAAIPFDDNLVKYEHREPTIVVGDEEPKGCWVAAWIWVPVDEMSDPVTNDEVVGIPEELA